MDETEIAVRLTDHAKEIGSLKHRMDEVESEQKALNSLAQSVAVIATKQDAITGDLVEIKNNVRAIMDKPARRWDGVVDKVLLLVVGAFMAWALSALPGA